MNLTVSAGSVADLLTVNSGTVVVTMSSSTGGTFTLTSPQSLGISTNGSGGSVALSCSSGIQTATITQSTYSEIYTFTPQGYTCAASTVVAVASGGGAAPLPAPLPDFMINNGALTTTNQTVELEIPAAVNISTMAFATSSSNFASVSPIPYASTLQWNLCGVASCSPGSYTIYGEFFTAGGNSYQAQHTITLTGVSTVTATTTVSAAPSIQSLQAQLNSLLATLQTLEKEASQRGISFPAGIQSGSSNTFFRNLTMGSRGNDVASLQRFLINQNSGRYAQKLAVTGATGYFWLLTRSALAEFQAKVGISPASGYFGPITRAYFQNH